MRPPDLSQLNGQLVRELKHRAASTLLKRRERAHCDHFDAACFCAQATEGRCCPYHTVQHIQHEQTTRRKIADINTYAQTLICSNRHTEPRQSYWNGVCWIAWQSGTKQAVLMFEHPTGCRETGFDKLKYMHQLESLLVETSTAWKPAGDSQHTNFQRTSIVHSQLQLESQ